MRSAALCAARVGGGALAGSSPEDQALIDYRLDWEASEVKVGHYIIVMSSLILCPLHHQS